MSLFGDLYSAPSGLAPSPLRGDDPGKSGGGFLSRSTVCPLVCVDVIKELGSVFCGSDIGKGGNKICYRQDCDVASHQMRPTSKHFPEDNMVFICSPARDLIYSKPSVPASKFGDNLERYLAEERPKESWKTLLTSLAKSEQASTEDLERLANHLHGRERSLPQRLAPLKKRTKLDIDSPTLDAGFEVTLMDLLPDLGSTDSLMLSNLRLQWRHLCANLETLRELQQGTKDYLKSLSSGTKDELARQDLELARLDTLVGDRKEERWREPRRLSRNLRISSPRGVKIGKRG